MYSLCYWIVSILSFCGLLALLVISVCMWIHWIIPAFIARPVLCCSILAGIVLLTTYALKS